MKQTTVKSDAMPMPLPGERSRSTLRLRILMEQQQKIEIGRRIYDLRESSPHTNRSIADAVGVHERSVAYWIAGDTAITWDNARAVAELFDVDVNWLWTGREHRPGPTPDPFATPTNEDAVTVEALLAQIAELDSRADSRHAALMSELSEVRDELALSRKREPPPERGRATGSK